MELNLINLSFLRHVKTEQTIAFRPTAFFAQFILVNFTLDLRFMVRQKVNRTSRGTRQVAF
jgi:hypothetical protein